MDGSSGSVRKREMGPTSIYRYKSGVIITLSIFLFFLKGKSVDKNGNPSNKSVCSLAPTTCSIVTGINSPFCPTCTSKWSVLGPNSHIGSHCGPTNARLRVHLGLKVVKIFVTGFKYLYFLAGS